MPGESQGHSVKAPRDEIGSVGATLSSLLLSFALLAGCAVSPEQAEQRELIDAEVDAVLSQPPIAAGEGDAEPKRCIREADYRSFQALGDRHLLFEGSRGRLWVNTLAHRCPDLRHGDVLVVRSFSRGRLCDMDSFEVADWFDWPWYRRWPWRWGAPWSVGVTCVLGEFQPVTQEQVDAVRALLRGD